MRKHCLKLHGVPASQYQCDSCSQIFDAYVSLKRHRRIHLTCKLCDKTFSRYPRMKIHLLAHTKKRKSSVTPLNRHTNKTKSGQNTLFRCLMCLHSFHGAVIQKHLWDCQAKRSCLIDRILEVTTQIKEEPLDSTQYENTLGSGAVHSSEQTQELLSSSIKQSKIINSDLKCSLIMCIIGRQNIQNGSKSVHGIFEKKSP